jgi:hypothetical protein
VLADGGSFIGYGDLSGQPISTPPLSLPVRGLTMKGISVGNWASLPEALRTADIRTAIELARSVSHLFPVAAEYDLAQVTDAVVHAEQSGRTGAVLLTSVHNIKGLKGPKCWHHRCRERRPGFRALSIDGTCWMMQGRSPPLNQTSRSAKSLN